MCVVQLFKIHILDISGPTFSLLFLHLDLAVSKKFYLTESTQCKDVHFEFAVFHFLLKFVALFLFFQDGDSSWRRILLTSFLVMGSLGFVVICIATTRFAHYTVICHVYLNNIQ